MAESNAISRSTHARLAAEFDALGFRIGPAASGALMFAAANDVGDKFPRGILFISTPLACGAVYFLGRWIGTRCSRYGILAVLLACVFGVSIGNSIDFMKLPPDAFQEVFGYEKSTLSMILKTGAGVLLFAVFCLLGYWRGRRKRILKYLDYLVSVLSPSTRDVLVSMAYEEVRTIMSQRLDVENSRSDRSRQSSAA